MVASRRVVIASVLAAIGLGACGSDSPTAGIDRGGVRVPVVAQGPITGFGSIVVGGVHYDVSKATIDVDGALASEADLALGQLVTVVGERDENGTSGAARSVKFQADVRGAIQSRDASRAEIVVLGQRVLIGASTVLALGSQPPAFASLDVGESVEVSGFLTAGGAIDATRVASVTAQSQPLVAGPVSGIDTALLRFNIRDLVVDYSAALLIEGFPAGQPANGDEVVVEGYLSATTGRFMARAIEREDEEDDDHGAGIEGREAEVEGRITRFVSALDFDVAARAVIAPSTTVYQGGSAASLTLDARVHVAGRFEASGVIRATKIEIEH